MSIKQNQNLELILPTFCHQGGGPSKQEKRNEEENKVGNRKLAWDSGEGSPLVLTSSIQPRNKLFRICYPILSCLVLSPYPR
jgi:hypothetical protein